MKNRSFALVIVAMFGTALGAGCKKKSEASPAPGAADKSGEKPAESGIGDMATGVPECDDFITKYVKCIDTKFPAEKRAAARQGFKMGSTEDWKQKASTPEGKAKLVEECKAVAQQSKDMNPNNCDY